MRWKNTIEMVTQKKKVKKNPTDNSRDKLLTGLINVLLK